MSSALRKKTRLNIPANIISRLYIGIAVSEWHTDVTEKLFKGAEKCLLQSGVKKENILAKCGWSPFEGYTFKSRITHTFVNGQLVYNAFKVKDIRAGKRLLFNR